MNSLNRGTKRLNDSSHGNIPRGPPQAAANAAGRPPRKDANEMSISMESSRSSALPNNISAHSEDLALSRDRMQLSNNPFTSSGSFNFSNSASFSGASANASLTSSSGGVAGSNINAQHGHSAYHNNNNNGTAASRYRMTYDIGGAVPAEEDCEYEEDDFEEEVERYESSYDYKQDGKSGGRTYK